MGSWLSSFTLAVTEVTERAELPWLTLSYSDLITGRGFKYVFQSSPTAEAQATALLPRIVDLATRSTGKQPTKVAFVGDNSASSVSFMKPIRGHVAKDLGLAIVRTRRTRRRWRTPRPSFRRSAPAVRTSSCFSRRMSATTSSCSTSSRNGDHGQHHSADRRRRHWTVPELAKVAGKEHLEGMIVGLANWPGKDLGDLEKRFVAKTGEPWFGHDSIFRMRT